MSFGTIISDLVHGRGTDWGFSPSKSAWGIHPSDINFGYYPDDAQIDTNVYDTGKALPKDLQFAVTTQLFPNTTRNQWMEVFGEDNVNTWDPSSTYAKNPRSPLISYPSETNGSWRNQKSYVNNKNDGSWNGLPDHLRHRNDDIDTTTYY